MEDDASIGNLASAVFDTGRRGAPLLGCDCVQCFGYCQVERDYAMRGMLERATGRLLRQQEKRHARETTT